MAVKPKKHQKFTPKQAPPRGSGGKFVSTKKKNHPSQKKVKKIKKKIVPKGPFTVPFGGKEIRRFYKNKWYFSLEDILSLGHFEKILKPLNELKKDKKVKNILAKNIVTIMKVDCADGKQTNEIIQAMIKKFKAKFPGSFFRWIENISKLPFNIVKPLHVIPQGNPSDRG